MGGGLFIKSFPKFFLSFKCYNAYCFLFGDNMQKQDELSVNEKMQTAKAFLEQEQYENAFLLFEELVRFYVQEDDLVAQADCKLKMAQCRFHQGQPDVAASLCGKVKNLFFKMSDENNQEHIFKLEPRYSGEQIKYSDLMLLCSEAAGLFEKMGNKLEQAEFICCAARCLFSLKEFASAFILFGQATDLYVELGNEQRSQMASVYYQALCLQNQKKYSDAIPLFDKAAQLFEKIGNKLGQAFSIFHRAECGLWLKQFASAFILFGQAKVLYVELGVEDSQMSALKKQAICLMAQESYSKAIPLYEEAARVYERTGNKFQQADSLLQAAECLKFVHRNNEAELYYESALRFFVKDNFPHLLRVLKLYINFLEHYNAIRSQIFTGLWSLLTPDCPLYNQRGFLAVFDQGIKNEKISGNPELMLELLVHCLKHEKRLTAEQRQELQTRKDQLGNKLYCPPTLASMAMGLIKKDPDTFIRGQPRILFFAETGEQRARQAKGNHTSVHAKDDFDVKYSSHKSG